MKWLDRLMGRSTEDTEDAEALTELKTSFRRVRRRTDAIIAEYESAELRRLGKRAP